jgi:hypothetical protein
MWRGLGMLCSVLELLMGIGLATSAGLNAYIPLMMLGLLSRYTDLITLPQSWHWLENGWTLVIIGGLLAIETVADKIPVVDHINDVIQTVIRPTAGGIAFGAASGAQTALVQDPGQFFGSKQWIPIAAGSVIGLVVHGMKATARPVVNVSTAGIGAPIVSTAEDVISASMSFFAIIFPFVIVFFLALVVWLFVLMRRRRKRRKAEKAELATLRAQQKATQRTR